MLRDIAFGVRQLQRQPAFAAAAIGSLALGIGLTTTLFSIVNGVLFKDQHVASRGTLVEIYTGLRSDFAQLTTSYPDYLDIRDGVSAFAGVAGSGYVRGSLAAGQQPQLVTGEAVTPNYFEVLGIAVARGRGFGPGEDTPPLAAARILEALLYGVSTVDPLAYLAAVVVLLLVAGAANMVPAFAASRVDPAKALRGD